MSARNYIKQLAELPTPFYFYDMVTAKPHTEQGDRSVIALYG